MAAGKDSQGNTVDLRVFSGNSGTWLLDRSRPKVYFTMYNSGYPVLIGYVFASASNPWILDWQENQRAKGIPWAARRSPAASASAIRRSRVSETPSAVETCSVPGA